MFKKFILFSVCSASLLAEVKTLESVIVTADKRDSALIDTQMSINVINETDIQDFNIKETKDIPSLVSNMYFTIPGVVSEQSFGSIRGISASMAGVPAFSIYVDDVYQSQLAFGLLDVERIEVLKGPQGTLYGRNSEAGVINIITKKPNFNKVEGSVNLELGQEKTKGLTGSINIPINDKNAIKFYAKRYENDGYFTNLYNNDKSQKQENTDLKTQYRSLITDKLELMLSLSHQDYKNDAYANYAPFSSKDMTKVNVDYMGNAYYKSTQGALKLTYDFDLLKLLSITTANNSKVAGNNDIDFSPIDIMKLQIPTKKKFFSQEFRLVSKESDVFQYTAGLFGFSENSKQSPLMYMNMPNMGMPEQPIMSNITNSDMDTKGVAIFAEGSYFYNDFKLTLGARFDKENKKIEFEQIMQTQAGNQPLGGAKEKKNHNTFLPKLALGYSINENIKPYFSIARGFRSGGFNTNPQITSAYNPEYTMNYELGLKSEFDNILFNAAIFYIDWKDMQVEVPTNNGTNFYMENAAKAVSKGAELEIQWAVNSNLLLGGNFGYTDAKYKEYQKGNINYNNKYVIDSPKYTVGLSSRYRFDNGIYLGANLSNFNDIYFDNDNTQKQSYTTLNAKIGYEKQNFEIYLYLDNAFDEEYVTRAFKMNEWIGRAGQPRKFGIAMTYRF